MVSETLKKAPLLTIAIPTFNRAEILDVSLSKLLPQVVGYKNEIEIIISDNASEDQTQDVIDRYRIKYANITIISNLQPFNTGYFGNFKKCRELSNGKYLWLLSDNDHVIGNVIDFLLSKIKFENDEVGVYYFMNNELPKPSINNNHFSISNAKFDNLINNHTAYKLTLISAVVILNDKSHDYAVISEFQDNSFLGFLFLCNALIKQDKISLISGKVLESAPCHVYFDIFRSWTADIMDCVQYMLNCNLLFKESEIEFVTGFLKTNILSHVINYRVHGFLHGKTYGTLKELEQILNSYYYNYPYYRKYIKPLFYPDLIFKPYMLFIKIRNRLKRLLSGLF